MNVVMFGIYYADLSGNSINFEQNGIRPVIVIQNSLGNQHSPTSIVIPITSEIKKEYLPTHCIIHRTEENGLREDSMVMAEQIRVVDKSRLLDYIGYLDNVKEQNDVLNTYFANVTGRKHYNSVLTKVVNKIIKFIKEGNSNGNAA